MAGTPAFGMRADGPTGSLPVVVLRYSTNANVYRPSEYLLMLHGGKWR